MIQQFNNTISSFVPYLCFAPDIQPIINQQFIEPQVKSFFADKENEFLALSAGKYISLEDFREIKFEYFYEEILTEISRDNDGRIRIIPKYAITLDKTITPQYCQKTSRSFGALTLGKQPVLYFIHFTIDEILNFLRLSSDSATSKTTWQPKSQKVFQYTATNQNDILPESEGQKNAEIPIGINQSSETPWIGFNQKNPDERYGIVISTHSRPNGTGYGFIWGDKTSEYKNVQFSSEDSPDIPYNVYRTKDAWKGELVRYAVVELQRYADNHAPFKSINVRLVKAEDSIIPRWKGIIVRAGYLANTYYEYDRKWAWIDINQDKEIYVDFELSPRLDNIAPRDLEGKNVSFIPVANFGNRFDPEKHHSVKAVYVELI